MVWITYISIRENSKFQQASLKPFLSVSIWKWGFEGKDSIDNYGVTIKNDGLATAINVKLGVNWASKKIPKAPKWANCKFGEKDFHGRSYIDVGNIPAKEDIKLSSAQLPTTLKIPFKELYGVRLIAMCEDVLGNQCDEYKDEKEFYLSDAEWRKFE